MNKKELDEVLKIMNEPITVNSINYKYFTQEQYDNLIRVYDNAKWLVDYSLQQSRFISELNERIEKAIEYIENNTYDDSLDGDGSRLMFEKANGKDLLKILKGEDNE